MADSDDSNPTPTPRTPREEVRRRLLAAAIQVFAEHGYAEARLDDIARVAGFTKGAVYSNFTSKQELFAAVLSDRAAEEFDVVFNEVDEPADTGDAMRRIAALISRRIADDTRRGQLGLEFAARATRDEGTRSALAPLRRGQRDAVAELISQLASRGVVREDVDPDVIALVMHCLTNGLSMEHLVDPDAVTTHAMEQAFNVVLTAFTTNTDT